MTVKLIVPGEVYRDQHKEVTGIFELVRECLEAHARHAEAQPEWALVNDLAHVRAQLVELAVRLTALAPTDEDEARDIIDMRLAALPTRRRRRASGAWSCVPIPSDEGDRV